MAEKLKIDFRFHKYTTSRIRQTMNYSPKFLIMFQGYKIGHIYGGDVYFLIKSQDICLNYEPILWGRFKDYHQAKEQVLANQEEIWQKLDIYHPLKLNVE